MRIAVAGGGGTVGRYVVQAARQAGHEAVVELDVCGGQDCRTRAGWQSNLMKRHVGCGCREQGKGKHFHAQKTILAA